MIDDIGYFRNLTNLMIYKIIICIILFSLFNSKILKYSIADAVAQDTSEAPPATAPAQPSVKFSFKGTNLLFPEISIPDINIVTQFSTDPSKLALALLHPTVIGGNPVVKWQHPEQHKNDTVRLEVRLEPEVRVEKIHQNGPQKYVVTYRIKASLVVIMSLGSNEALIFGGGTPMDEDAKFVRQEYVDHLADSHPQVLDEFQLFEPAGNEIVINVTF